MTNSITSNKFTSTVNTAHYTYSQGTRNGRTKIPSITNDSLQRRIEQPQQGNQPNYLGFSSKYESAQNIVSINIITIKSRQKNNDRNKRTRKSRNPCFRKTVSFAVHRGSSSRSFQNNIFKPGDYIVTYNMDVLLHYSGQVKQYQKTK